MPVGILFVVAKVFKFSETYIKLSSIFALFTRKEEGVIMILEGYIRKMHTL